MGNKAESIITTFSIRNQRTAVVKGHSRAPPPSLAERKLVMWWRVCPEAPRPDPVCQFTTVTVAAALQRIWQLRGSVRVLKDLGWGGRRAEKCAWLQQSEDWWRMSKRQGYPNMTLWTLRVAKSQGDFWQRSLHQGSLPSLESFIFFVGLHTSGLGAQTWTEAERMLLPDGGVCETAIPSSPPRSPSCRAVGWAIAEEHSFHMWVYERSANLAQGLEEGLCVWERVPRGD